MSWRELIRKLEKAGWKRDRQAKGSHEVYRHPEFNYPIMLAQHGKKEVGSGLANDILKKAGVK